MMRTFRSLDLALTLSSLSSPSLDRRLHALKELRLCVEYRDRLDDASDRRGTTLGMITAVVTGTSGDSDALPPLPVTTPFLTQQLLQTSTYLAQWMIDNTVIELILDSQSQSPHVELIRRMDRVMRFLARHGALSDGHLSLALTLATSGRHESIQSHACDLLSKLSQALSLRHLNYLYQHLQSLTPIVFDGSLCSLVQAVTRAAYDRIQSLTGDERDKQSKFIHSYGTDLFWNLLALAHGFTAGTNADSDSTSASSSDSPIVSAEVTARAERYLLELLSMDFAIPQRPKFMERLILNIKQKHAVSESFALLAKLLRCYADTHSDAARNNIVNGWLNTFDRKFISGSDRPSQSAVIESLEQRFGLIALCINDLIQYHDEIVSIVMTREDPNTDLSSILTERFEALKTRQMFLVYVLHHSSLDLTRAQIDQLWHSLVESAVSEVEREFAFLWLTEACVNDSTDSDSVRALSDEICFYILNTKLLSYPPSQYTPAAFRLLYRFFLSCHFVRGNVRVDESAIPSIEQQRHELLIENAEADEEIEAAISEVQLSQSQQLASPSHSTHQLTIDSTNTSTYGDSTSGRSDSVASDGSSVLSHAMNSNTNNHTGTRHRSSSVSSTSSFTSSLLSTTNSHSSSTTLTAPSSHSSLTSVGRELVVLNYNAIEDVLRVLWEIGLKNPSKVVGHRALVLLNACHVHTNVSANRQSQPINAKYSDSRIKDEHLKRCLNQLSTALSIAARQSDERTRRLTARCVFLINNLLQGFGSSPRAEHQYSTLRVEPMKELRTAPFSIPIDPQFTIGELRRLVFSHLAANNPGLTSLSIEMEWNEKKLISSHVALKAIPFHLNDSITVKKLTDSFGLFSAVPGYSQLDIAKATAQSVKEEKFLHEDRREDYSRSLNVRPRLSKTSRAYTHSSSPLSTIAADPASFDRLFALLTPGSTIANDVWEILKILPLNSSHLRRLLSLDGVSVDAWTPLIDDRSTYRLLYSLLCIDDLVHDRLGEEYRQFDRQRRLAWCSEFIKRGGLNALIKAATARSLHAFSQSKHGSRTVHAECCELLYRLITDFFALDPAFPIIGSIVVDASMTRGRLMGHASFEPLCARLCCDSILPILARVFDDDTCNTDSVSDSDSDSVSDLVQSGLLLLAGCVTAKPAIVAAITQMPAQSLDTFLSSVLLRVPHADNRKFSRMVLYRICRSQCPVQCRTVLMDRIVALLESHHSRISEYNSQSECYWALLIQLLESGLMTAQQQRQLAQCCMSLVNSDDSAMVVPQSMIGILRLVAQAVERKLYTVEQLLTLAQHIYSDCLFPPPDPRTASLECHGGIQCRSAAYHALLAVASHSPSLHCSVLSLVSNDSYWTNDRTLCGWRYDPHSLTKSHHSAAVGLRNLGCTCYVNSFIQQIYACTKFRDSVLSYSVTSGDHPPAANENTTEAISPRSATIELVNGNEPLELARSLSTPAALFTPSAAKQRAASSLLPSSPSNGKLSLLTTATDSTGDIRSSYSSLLTELQSVFARLFLSSKSWLDPHSLCASLRDSSGSIVNLSEQKDVNEFAGQLFDSLDGIDSTLLASFRGTIANQMISHECSHSSEREEPFYMLSLTVKNKKSLQESLASFIEGDLLDDDNKWICNDCQSKVAATKRSCLSKTPDRLIFHLKRFEFDFDSMKKVKINDRFEFPNVVNVFPYTKEGIRWKEEKDSDNESRNVSVSVSENDCQYELTGILIHSGIADAGHYYSFLRQSDNRWIEINDELVQPFDPARIPSEAFGDSKPLQTQGQEIHRNAYMLFYQRCNASSISDNGSGNNKLSDSLLISDGLTLSHTTSPAVTPRASELKTRSTKNSPFSPTARLTHSTLCEAVDGNDSDSNDTHPRLQITLPNTSMSRANWLATHPSLPTSITTTLLDEIWCENLDLIQDQRIFDFTFNSFTYQLTMKRNKYSQYSDSDSDNDSGKVIALKSSQVAVMFVFRLLCRSSENGSLIHWLDSLETMIVTNGDARQWLLTQATIDRDWTHTLLFVCPHSMVREAFVHLLVRALQLHRKGEGYCSVDHSLVQGLYSLLLSWLPYIRRHPRTYGAYLRLLFECVRISGSEHQWFVDQSLLSSLIDFYADATLVQGFNARATQNNSIRRIPPVGAHAAIAAMSVLVRACHTEATTSGASQPPTALYSKLLPMTEKDRKKLFDGVVTVTDTVGDSEKTTDELKSVEDSLGDSNDSVSITSDSTKEAVTSTSLPLIPLCLLDRASLPWLRSLLIHSSWEDRVLSTALITRCFEHLRSELTHSVTIGGTPASSLPDHGGVTAEFHNTLELVSALCVINDSLIAMRVDIVLSSLLELMKLTLTRRFSNDERFLLTSHRTLMQLSLASPQFAVALKRRERDWSQFDVTYRKVRNMLDYQTRQ